MGSKESCHLGGNRSNQGNAAAYRRVPTVSHRSIYPWGTMNNRLNAIFNHTEQVELRDDRTELILCFQRIKDNAAIIRVALGGVTGLD